MSADLGFKGDVTCAMQCSDLDASIEWYRSVLGLELVYKLDKMGWCELSSPVTNVTLGLSQVETPAVKGGATLTWGVADIDATRRALEAKDVRFDGDTMTIPDVVRLATFFDPDGNTYMLAQSLAPMG